MRKQAHDSDLMLRSADYKPKTNHTGEYKKKSQRMEYRRMDRQRSKTKNESMSMSQSSSKQSSVQRREAR